MTAQIIIPILLLLGAAFVLSMPKYRGQPAARVIAVIAALGAVVYLFFTIGYQVGRDAALRDNRAEAQAAASPQP